MEKGATTTGGNGCDSPTQILLADSNHHPTRSSSFGALEIRSCQDDRRSYNHHHHDDGVVDRFSREPRPPQQEQRLVDHNTLLLHKGAFVFWDKKRDGGAIYEHDPRMTQPDGPLTHMISGLLLFNLALSFHLRAMSGVGGGPGGMRRNRAASAPQQQFAGNAAPATTTADHLRAAQQIYQNALVAVQRGCCCSCCSRPEASSNLARIRSSSSSTMAGDDATSSRVHAPSSPGALEDYYSSSTMKEQVVLAIYNNLAHLSFHFFEMDSVEHYLAGMRSILFRPTNNNNNNNNNKEHRHLETNDAPPRRRRPQEQQQQIGQVSRQPPHGGGPNNNRIRDRHFVVNARVLPLSIAQTSPAA
ncbi:hypothetical protein ACA910_013797 [Epithemia clementina (nom. ined.)]